MDHTMLLASYLSQYGYIALFFMVLIGGNYIPIPSGIALIAAGAFARQHYLSFLLSFFVGLSASVLSDLITYYIARRIGRKQTYQKFVESHPFAERIDMYMQKNPKRTILLSRFVGFASTPVNALAGLTQVPLTTFLIYDLFGDIVCILAYLIAGYYIGAAWEYDAHLTSILLGIALVAIALVYVLVYTLIRKTKSSSLS